MNRLATIARSMANKPTTNLLPRSDQQIKSACWIDNTRFDIIKDCSPMGEATLAETCLKDGIRSERAKQRRG
jgi:hypothetical protein